MRDDPKHPNTWGLPGGKVEAGETLVDSINRECTEELGTMPEYIHGWCHWKSLPLLTLDLPTIHFFVAWPMSLHQC